MPEGRCRRVVARVEAVMKVEKRRRGASLENNGRGCVSTRTEP